MITGPVAFTQARLAILHSDGSLDVLEANATIEGLADALEFTNVNERNPAHLSRPVTVEVRVVGPLLLPPAPAPDGGEAA